MIISRQRLELFADYLQDDDQELGSLSDAWTQEAVDRLLATGQGVVGIGTVRNMIVPVEVEIHDREPADDSDDWDQIVECALEITTGRIVVAGCTDYFPDAARIEVAPAIYAVRASYGNLDALSEDGLEGDDRYRIQLWATSNPIPTQVRKRRPQL
jgi:hypothetical protein